MKAFSPNRLNPWREIAIFMIILMEVSWITPWFRSLTAETYAADGLRVFSILSCVILFSYLLIRGMDYLHLKKSIRQGFMVTFLVVGSYVGIKTLLYAHETISLIGLISRPLQSFADVKFLIPVEFIVIIAVLICFWRGLFLAQVHIGPSSVMGDFYFGIVMFVAFILFNTIVTGEEPGDFFFLFLFSSLIAICSARMTVVGMLRGGEESRFNRSWFLGILFSALLVVGLSYLLGGVLADQFSWIGVLFLGLIGSFVVLLWIIINPIISFVVTILTKLLQNSNAISGLSDSFQKLNDMMSRFGQKIFEELSKSWIGILISRWGPTIKAIILSAIVILVILAVVMWMAINLWRDRERHLIDSEEKSNLQVGNLLRTLLDMLLQGWNKTLNSLEQMTNLRQRQRIRAAARIRQVYAELMELCESLDQPRPEAKTPLEFMPKLERLFPEFNLEVDMITQAYLSVRYGQLPETKNEIEDVETAWKKLHSAGREMLGERKHNKA
jgi:hypothetical protein